MASLSSPDTAIICSWGMLRTCMNASHFTLLFRNGQTLISWNEACRKTKYYPVHVVIVLMWVFALSGSGFKGVFHVAAGTNKSRGEGFLRCNNCELPWPRRAFMEDSEQKNILKLQLDCGPFSTATHKESLCHKPTQAERRRGGKRRQRCGQTCEQTSGCLPGKIWLEDDLASNWNSHPVIAV